MKTLTFSYKYLFCIPNEISLPLLPYISSLLIKGCCVVLCVSDCMAVQRVLVQWPIPAAGTTCKTIHAVNYLQYIFPYSEMLSGESSLFE